MQVAEIKESEEQLSDEDVIAATEETIEIKARPPKASGESGPASRSSRRTSRPLVLLALKRLSGHNEDAMR